MFLATFLFGFDPDCMFAPIIRLQGNNPITRLQVSTRLPDYREKPDYPIAPLHPITRLHEGTRLLHHPNLADPRLGRSSR